MDRSLCELSPSAPNRDWFQFDEYDFCYVPHRSPTFPTEEFWVCCFYRRPSAEELATDAQNACWHGFSNNLAFCLSKNRTPWFEYCAHRWNLAPLQAGNPCVNCFAVDDVYCGEDFVMVQLGYSQCRSMRFHDMSYRWMVVWIHHGGPSWMVDGLWMDGSRYGQLLRRPIVANFRATSRANSRRQPWLNSVLHLVAP